jgi:hypothetical protein
MFRGFIYIMYWRSIHLHESRQNANTSLFWILRPSLPPQDSSTERSEGNLEDDRLWEAWVATHM